MASAAEADDPSLAATLEKFRLYETRAVSISRHPPPHHYPPNSPSDWTCSADLIRPGRVQRFYVIGSSREKRWFRVLDLGKHGWELGQE